jgi:FKBP-type peptidyl-prolyl cis-trans isomerase FklB
MEWERRTRMKQALFIILGLALLAPVSRAADKPPLADGKSTDSYSLGYEFGNNLRRQGLEIDADVLISAVTSGLEGKEPVISRKEMSDTLKNLRKKVAILANRRYEEVSAANLEKGRVFLEQNRTKEGVRTLPGGLQYRVLREGSGPVPKGSDSVTLKYRGAPIDGTEFDSSDRRGEPTAITVNGVIKAWTEALRLMKTGSKWQIFSPAELAYGKRQFGRIPPNSALIFEIELLSINADAAGEAKPAPGKDAPEEGRDTPAMPAG